VWACVQRWVFNPFLNSPQLMESECRHVGSKFRTTGATTWNSIDRAESRSMERTCHVAYLTRDVGNRHTDVVDICWASTTNRIIVSDSHLEQCALTYWQLVEHVAKNSYDVLKLASTGGSVENHLKF